MGYMHIENLHKDRGVLDEPECYALEKIHGTSAHITWKVAEGKLHFFSGGEPNEKFVALFNVDALTTAFAICHRSASDIVIYGEAYGGKCMKMSGTYGPALRFVAFEAKVGETWLTVPEADALVREIGLEFVHYVRIPTALEALNAERDAPSVQAKRNGVENPGPREGIVLRPLVEQVRRNGKRLMSKYKIAQFGETKTPRDVTAEELQMLADANAIADEWVTEMRLTHVLDALGNPAQMSDTPKVVTGMIADVYREASGEIVESKEAKRAIGRRTAQMFKARVTRAETNK